VAVPLDLTSVRAKLARSQEHAQTVKREVKAWINRNPYSSIEKTSADTTRHSVILMVNEPAHFQRWTLMFADFLSNLRAALDYLVFAIAMRESAPDPPRYEGSLMFPITDCRAKFDDAVSRHRLGDISAGMRRAIQQVQPYNRPHKHLPPLLAILRDFNNADKHKLLRLGYAAVSEGNMSLTGDMPPGALFKAIPNAEEVKDGAEIFAMVSNVPTPDMKYERRDFEIIVAVRHRKRDPGGPEGSDRTDLGAMMYALSGEVRVIINTVASQVE
jgi:hypothetical protein